MMQRENGLRSEYEKSTNRLNKARCTKQQSKSKTNEIEATMGICSAVLSPFVYKTALTSDDIAVPSKLISKSYGSR
jgi:hypothetical protein